MKRVILLCFVVLFTVMHTLFSCLNSEAYQTFEGNLKELLCKPLEGLFFVCKISNKGVI